MLYSIDQPNELTIYGIRISHSKYFLNDSTILSSAQVVGSISFAATRDISAGDGTKQKVVISARSNDY